LISIPQLTSMNFGADHFIVEFLLRWFHSPPVFRPAAVSLRQDSLFCRSRSCQGLTGMVFMHMQSMQIDIRPPDG
jgi:hypothetical protein